MKKIIEAYVGIMKDNRALEAITSQGINIGKLKNYINEMGENGLIALIVFSNKSFKIIAELIHQQQMILNTLLIKQGLLTEKDLGDSEKTKQAIKNLGLDKELKLADDYVEETISDIEDLINKKGEDTNGKD